MPQAPATRDQTLDQRRASHAWEAIQNAKGLRDDKAKEYARHALKLPVRILSAGLGQALAFVLAKAGPPGSQDHKAHIKQLHDDITDWAEKSGLPLAREGSLLESIIAGDSDFLRRATDEVLSYLKWLNRFAEAELGGKEGD